MNHGNTLNIQAAKAITEDQLVFSLKNPVIASHKVQGQFILPGLAYIDIVLQFFRKNGYSVEVLQVKNLVIHQPLIVEAESKLAVVFHCSENGPGKWKITIASGNADTPLLYATTEVFVREMFATDDKSDFDALKKAAKNSYPIAQVYELYRTMDLVHEGFMQGEGNIFELENGLLYEAELGKDAAALANHFMVHPTLIDASAIATRRLFNNLVDDEENLFLPLYYESFRASALVNKRCYAYIPNSSIARNQDLISLSIHFFDLHGNKIAELTNLTTKMVRGKLGNVRSKQAPTSVVSSSVAKKDGLKKNVIHFLKQLIAQKLNSNAEEIDINAGYYDLGLDSANLLQLVEAISEKINTDLPPTLLFEYPNISVLAGHLLNDYATAVSVKLLSDVKEFMPLSQNVSPSGQAISNVSLDEAYQSVGKNPAHLVPSDRDIAVVGLSGRYPKAANLQEFWENLKSGMDCITEVPLSRWDVSTYKDMTSPSGKPLSKWGGFIDDVDHFDPLFFRIAAREAEVMDPQERLFLETCWQALEDAGYTPESLTSPVNAKRKVGVFAGVMHKDYTLIGKDALAQGHMIPLSINNASIANRVSYCCNFHGPSMVIDTACSSSLVAVHLAIQSILSGECDAALAGGVNLSLHPDKYVSYGLIDMHSSDGYCKAFGKGGDGYVSAEGVGAILLKPLKKAVADNDNIYAVIKGSSINHVGSVSGMTVPSPVAQSEMIKDCLDKIGINPRTLSYIEAHGTGTSLGDPIEVQGLVKAFSAYTNDKQFCAIGSVKSNIGHAEAAAGISGLTKLLLQFRHKMLVPSLHADEPNPYIDFQNSPFFVQKSASVWNRLQIIEAGKTVVYPRRASISSFGASGTNAHLILEEYVDNQINTSSDETTNHQSLFIVPLSAKNKSSLKHSVINLLDYLNAIKISNGEEEMIPSTSVKKLLDVAFTLQVGRVALDERVIFITTEIAELKTQLQSYLDGAKTKYSFQANIKQDLSNDLLLEDENVIRDLLLDKNENNFNKVADAWVHGASIPWKYLYQDTTYYKVAPCKVSLPTYPFARERYWVPQSAAVSMATVDKFEDVQHHNTDLPARDNTLSSDDTIEEELSPEKLQEDIVYKLKVLFSSIVKFGIHSIDENELLEAYGIDSVIIVELNKRLAQVYGELPSTLFYEYQTLKALAGYLTQNHRSGSLAWTGKELSSQKTNIKTTNIIGYNNQSIASQAASKVSQRVKYTEYKSKMPAREPIAIIGINGRYAQADNLKMYWENLKVGKDCISEIPEGRWDRSNFFHADREKAVSLGKSYGKWGSFVDGFNEFDPRFFNVSPKEARGMDPQIRIFIECCWHVLEDAGYTRQQLMDLYQAKIGVFAGVTRGGFSFYANELMKSGQYPLNGVSAVANRVSYLLNLKGPSVPIDTMCSSSLTAIHEACESLIKGECYMAIAGGVNLLTHPSEYVILSANNFLSSDGRCRSFGANGDGYVPGEGVGTVLLKPLSKALADNDQIHAIITGSSINHGGKTNGYTVPNPVAQAELVRSAFDVAGINARHVSYIEAHGTGTPLGDPIEIAGLAQAFKADTNDLQFCSIGSSKSNIGHLESAAGIAGLTKIVLQMKHGMLVPSLHATEVNPNINFSNSPFFLQQELSEWKRPSHEVDGIKSELPRIAGISSFGAGGSNAHIVLEEYIPEKWEKAESRPQEINAETDSLIILSAKNEERLTAYAQRVLNDIEQSEPGSLSLRDIAFTYQVGREAMEVRLALEVRSINELIGKLKRFINGERELDGVYFGSIKDHKETISILAEDKDIAATVSAWFAGKKYGKILNLWVKGLHVNWNLLYTNDHGLPLPKRISLPVYPFENQKYWFDESVVKDTTDKASSGKEIAYAESDNKHEIHETLLLEPYWKTVSIADKANKQSTYERRIAVICGVDDVTVNALRESISDTDIISFPLLQPDIADKFQALTEFLFKTIQQIFKSRPKGKTLLQVAISLEHEDLQTMAAVSGLLKAANLENSRFIGQLITTTSEVKAHQLLSYLRENGVSPNDRQVKYQRDSRFILDWKEVEKHTKEICPWKNSEVYLITGGAGGLGLLFAKDIAKNTKGVTLVLTGRSADLSEKQKNEIDQLRKLGTNIIYWQTDVTCKEEVQDLIKNIQSKFGALHGLIHAAGMIRDNYMINKQAIEFDSVLAPKVHGTVNLDEATADIDLKFFILFSSIASTLGNPGQTDYATANAFMDEFAYSRTMKTSGGKRKGKTLSVNWPLWKDGGMHIDEATAKFMEESSGMIPLRTEAGISAIYKALQMPHCQFMVLYGNRNKINESLHPPMEKPHVDEIEEVTVTESASVLYDKTLQKLQVLFGEAVGMEAHQIDEEEVFDKFGIDSIIITQLNQKLTVFFDGLSKTLFYEYPNLAGIAAYLVEDHAQNCRRWTGLDNQQRMQAPVSDSKKVTSHIQKELKTVAVPPYLSNITAPISGINVWSSRQPIAIIGISGRYPGAPSLDAFWENLKSGKDCITVIPEDRWDMKDFFDPDKERAAESGKSYNKWGGFIDGFANFDPSFFGISPREALTIDPHERLFLQSCWEVFEDAGYTRDRLAKQHKGQVGVFAGVTKTGFELYGAELWKTEQVYPRTSFSSVANRVSYLLNLNGPSLPVDTMCSSSLTAVHEACENLYQGTCEMAVAGGVNLYLHPSSYIGLCQQYFLSTDGKCRSFGAGGDGFVPGEGVGTILLKPLGKAVADNDHIYAVIKSTSINHGGKTNGYTVPNPIAQADLIRKALDKAGLNARDISYVEAHGTGTSLGDPIEITGLSQAFQKDTNDVQFCAIGSCKSNIGHLEAAAGIAGLTKIVLQMKHQMLAPSLHADNLNPNIDFERSPFVVNKNLTSWERPTREHNGQKIHTSRIACISSFGAGGANAHVILEEYTTDKLEKQNATDVEVQKAIVLSAKNTGRLKEYAKRLHIYLEDPKYANDALEDIEFTLQTGREQMEARLALLVNTKDELISRLKAFADQGSITKGMYLSEGKDTKGDLVRYSKDEDVLDLLSSWASKGKYDKVLNFWVKGLTIDWEKLNGGQQYRSSKKISLPVYPFNQERFWIKSPWLGKNNKSTTPVDVIQTPVGQHTADTFQILPARKNDLVEFELSGGKDVDQENFELLTFGESWKEQALKNKGAATPYKVVVCFLSQVKNQQAFLRTLHKGSGETKVVFIADQSAIDKSTASDVYTMDLTDEDLYKQTLQEIVRSYGQIDGMLYLFPLESASYIENFYPLFSLIRSIDSEKLNIKKLILSGSWHNADIGSLNRCFLESWIGIERTARIILPGTSVTCAYMDVGLEASLGNLFENLYQELQLQNSGSVLYLDTKRYVYETEKIVLTSGSNLMRPGGTYLITGGFGGLGSLFARHLSKAYGANVVLTGRSPLNVSMEQGMADIERLGGKVMYLQADICVEGEIKPALESIKKRFGRIHGVIHAAGVSGEAVIYQQDFAQFERVLRPKIDGTIILDNLLSEEQLDFTCYFSSSAAVLGDFGACNYAIGNRFQMAYANHRNQLVAQGSRYGKTVVINWPLWRNGGMGFKEAEGTKMYLKSSGQRFLESDEGIAMFEKVINSSSTQCLVFAGKPSRVKEFLEMVSAKQKFERLVTAVKQNLTGKRIPDMRGFSTDQCIEWDIRNQVEKLIKIPKHEINVRENFADFGFDSIALTKFASALSRHYGIEIVPALFFSYTNVEQLAVYFSETHAAVMESFYKESATYVDTEAIRKQPLEFATVKKDSLIKENDKSALKRTISPHVHEPIAIIGMSGRFPEARNIEEMWTILAEGKDVVREISDERFDWRKYYIKEEGSNGTINCKWSGQIPGIKEFDPLFFEISPREAELMDPRQRLLLQEAWKALEDAGYGPDQIKKNKISLYVGAEESTYSSVAKHSSGSSITANHNAILSARLSYFLNLTGPAMTINTACSSGSVAVHQACMSLRNQECDTAIAAGVSLLIGPESFMVMSDAGMLSPDGKCYTFDKRANGIVPGEAVAVVVLKRLSQAQADGDPIYATIIGSGLNYDGKTNGITAPSGIAQSTLLKTVYDQCQVDPENIEYIVSHGTGTKLGDPVEVNALQDTFKRYTTRQSYCAITSTKTNFGHTLAASGIVGLISLVQALRHQTIPASLHCVEENDYINWKQSPFYINKNSKVWTSLPGKERIGAVSAFGMSGTNAHLVVQSYTEIESSQGEAPYHLLVLSAKTKESLQFLVNDLLNSMRDPSARMTDMSYTLLCGRHHFKFRLAMVVKDRDEAINVLEHWNTAGKSQNVLQGEVPRDFRGQTSMRKYIDQLLSSAATANLEGNCREDLLALAELYCQGYEISGTQLLGTFTPRRIHMPTYTFTRDHYWVSEKIETTAAKTVAQTQVSNTQRPHPTNNSTNENRKPEIQIPGINFSDANDILSSIPPKQENGIKNKPYINGHHDVLTKANGHSNGRVLVVGKNASNENPVLKLSESKEQLHIASTKYIKNIIASTIKLAPDKIEETAHLEQYGLDSILIVQLKNQMEDIFGALPANLFFEYSTIEMLVQYFVDTHSEKMKQLLADMS